MSLTFFQDISPVSWKLGAKIIEECSEKLKPHITKAVVSMGSSLEDYAPILSVVCKDKHDTAENVNDDCAKDVVCYLLLYLIFAELTLGERNSLDSCKPVSSCLFFWGRGNQLALKKMVIMRLR